MPNYKYRCKDGMCGADDCDNCYPRDDWEEQEEQSLQRWQQQQEEDAMTEDKG